MGIESLRERMCCGLIRSQKKSERFQRIFKASRGFESRRELKAVFVTADFSRNFRDLAQCQQSWPRGVVQPFKASSYQDTILAVERHNVSDCAQRNQIEEWPHIEVEEFR